MTKLPSREVLGTWAPTSDDMTVMELDSELTNANVKSDDAAGGARGNDPPRYAQSELGVINNEVKGMLQDGIIEKGNGAWGFPVVFVKKKDGPVHFCIDYRMLNAITKRDVYLVPRLDDTLDNLHGTKRHASLDLHAGYWQGPVVL
ncbi:hypothetical protein PR001_g6127 [Phytophthora rubi]|uniref:Reverse transcriptase domain-containing protein n=1 Tax=Phytophthora rubi TaxID=129364 RepID=A0A6A3NQ89_9STRA|nr:hypothetical protein PR001_g6127 [Phytophthora rubi]